MTQNIKFYDTCGLININANVLEKEFFMTSSKVLTELENIKTSSKKDEDVKAKARFITRFLRNNSDKYKVCVVMDVHFEMLKQFKLEENNDNLIMMCAKEIEENLGYDITFVTDDLACANIAEHIVGLKVQMLSENQIDRYVGYKELNLNTEEINILFSDLENGINTYNFLINEYLILKNTDLKQEFEFRFDGNTLCNIKLPPSKHIKGWNAQQRCAIDLLNNKDIPIKIIAGTYGSGKTLLSVRMGLYHVLDKGTYSKILLVRNPIGSGEEVGFLPGSKEEKIRDFYKPIENNLDGGEFQLQSLIQRELVDMEIPYYMKGLSLTSTYILVDEAEDLDLKGLKLIGTRLAEGSCVVFSGDYKQAEFKYARHNGLLQLIEKLKGNPLVGVVVLSEDVRSCASKVFSEID